MLRQVAMPRRLLSLLLLALSGGCAPIPIIHADPPVNPTPVDPTPPVTPPVTPPSNGAGSIDEAGYAAVVEGASEADVLARLGEPFRRTPTAGYVVWLYTFAGSDGVAWFFVKGGVVERKSRQ